MLANISRLSPGMIGEDLGRTKSSVESRVKTLRRRGVKIAYVPAGRRNTVGVDLSVNRLTTEPELSPSSDRQVLREELAAYLANEVNARRMLAKVAFSLVGKLKRRVLNAPDHELKRYLAMPVVAVVKEVA